MFQLIIRQDTHTKFGKFRMTRPTISPRYGFLRVFESGVWLYESCPPPESFEHQAYVWNAFRESYDLFELHDGKWKKLKEGRNNLKMEMQKC